MNSRGSSQQESTVARGLRKDAKIRDFKPVEGKAVGTELGKSKTPWLEGNQHATKHNFYSTQISKEEKADREAWEQAVVADLGGPSAISTAQSALIHSASFLRLKLERIDLAFQEGKEPAPEHTMAAFNSFRLMLNQIGLEKRSKPTQSLQDFIRQESEK